MKQSSLRRRSRPILYLASQSPRRHQLIRQLRRPFAVVPSRYREFIRKADTPARNAMRNAIGKAKRAQVRLDQQGIVIGADTFLWFQGRILGKPRSMVEAWKMLRSLRGKSHWVYTGVCLIDIRTGKLRAGYDRSKVTFNAVDEAFIARMFAKVDPLDKAGGYAVQETGGRLIRSIQGHKSTVIGFPLERLRKELKILEAVRRL